MPLHRRMPESNHPRRSTPAWVLALVIFLLLFGDMPAFANEADSRQLFGRETYQFSDLKALTKWTGALERYFAEKRVAEGSCEKNFLTRCHLQEWIRFLDGLRGKNRWIQVEAVNRYLNTVPYLEDPINYGVPEYWATPSEHLSRQGDCEDYAIAKFLSLRELGFADKDLRVAVVQDLNLRVLHAVLVVYDGDQPYILDSQTRYVLPAFAILHYQPIYAVNETHWWLYRPF